MVFTLVCMLFTLLSTRSTASSSGPAWDGGGLAVISSAANAAIDSNPRGTARVVYGNDAIAFALGWAVSSVMAASLPC
jgi:hypothetical protein